MKKITNWFISIVAALSIITISVIITLNSKWLYYMDIDKLDIENRSGFSKEVIVENYNYIIDYNTKINVGEFELPSLISSNEGKIHFEEVRRIFIAVHIISAFGLLSIIYSIYMAFKKGKGDILKKALIISIVIPLLTLLSTIVLSFENVFVIFHKIMFRNDYWIFDPYKDPIINILPEEFFMHSAMMIIFISIAIWVILYKIYSIAKIIDYTERTPKE